MDFSLLPKEDDDAIPFSWQGDQDSLTGSTWLSSFNSDPGNDPLKRESKHGVFLSWSEQSPPWIHPDDHEIADQLVPGNRIFRRVECGNFADRKLGYSEYSYGQQSFRGLPALWLEIQSEGFQLGDAVEIKSQNGKLRPGMASILEIVWNRKSRTIEYVLSSNQQRINRAFSFNDIRPACRLGEHLTTRELELASLHRIW